MIRSCDHRSIRFPSHNRAVSSPLFDSDAVRPRNEKTTIERNIPRQMPARRRDRRSRNHRRRKRMYAVTRSRQKLRAGQTLNQSHSVTGTKNPPNPGDDKSCGSNFDDQASMIARKATHLAARGSAWSDEENIGESLVHSGLSVFTSSARSLFRHGDVCGR